MRPSTDDAAAINPQRPARMPVWKSGACIGGPFDRTNQFYQSGQRANRRVGRLEFRVRTLMAEPARFEMNEAGVFPFERGKIEGRAIRRVDIAAVDQDVAIADQFGQPRRSAGIIGIERDARLVEIQERKPRALSLGGEWRGAAKRIALEWLDLPDRRTEVREQAGAVTRRCRTSDLDNVQMRQRPHSASSLPSDQRRLRPVQVSC